MSSYSEMNTSSTSLQASYAAAAASGASDGGLYVPTHRRNSIDSNSSSLMSRSSTRIGSHSRASSIASSSPMAQHTSLPNGPSSFTTTSASSTPRLPIYNISQLLHLSHSPMAAISPESRTHIRNTVPEISMNRKQRKARELREREGPEAVQARHRRSASSSTIASGRSSPSQSETQTTTTSRTPLNTTHRANAARPSADLEQRELKKQKRDVPAAVEPKAQASWTNRARALPSGPAAGRRTLPFGSAKSKRGLAEEGSWRKASQDAAKVFSMERQRSGQPVVLAM